MYLVENSKCIPRVQIIMLQYFIAAESMFLVSKGVSTEIFFHKHPDGKFFTFVHYHYYLP